MRVSKSTLNFLYFVSGHLEKFERSAFRRMYYRHYFADHRENIVELEELRSWLLYLDQLAGNHDWRIDDLSYLSEQPEENWLVCEEDLEVIPLYREALSVSAFRYIIEPKSIPNLLAFVGIPGTRNAVDLENHNFGYHFHYGKVKSGKLRRSNVLLTFNPNETILDESKKPPLYSEYHGERHFIEIDVDTIGINKRKPIYLVCCDEAKKRGFQNFKHPKKEARVFFPLVG